MPNYVRNIVRVFPGSRTYEKLRSTVNSGKKIFDSFYKTPEDLLDSDSWYGWRMMFWGTQWEAIDPYVIEDSDELFEFEFDTAKTAPLKLWARLGCHDDAFRMKCCYADEDRGFNCGTMTVEGNHANHKERTEDYVFAERVWKDTDPSEFDKIWEEI